MDDAMKKTALEIRNEMELFWANRHLNRLIRRIEREKWNIIKKQALALYGAMCHRCGSIEQINVDHIKPKSKYPQLRFDLSNLQILCWPCNKEKGNKHETDYRKDFQLI